MIELLDYPFMQRALLAALLVGVAAPAVGIYLVQRRQAIMGDGIGHVALTGVALGFLLNTSPVWTAVLVASLGAVAMELIRWYGKARGDLALAMLFYGGMAGGVLIINLSPNGSNASLTTYLFGSVTTVSGSDVVAIVCLSGFVLAASLGLRRQLFAVCQDEEFARVTGLPVRLLNLLLALTAAVTVTVAMRVVGLLLVSALMVIPVAAAQQATRGFAGTLGLSVLFGVAVTLSGTAASFYADVPPGASIVVLAIALFGLVTALAAPLARRRARRDRDARAGEVLPDGEAAPGTQPDASRGGAVREAGAGPAPEAAADAAPAGDARSGTARGRASVAGRDKGGDADGGRGFRA
ncbi:zinc transport system permease protein [Streptomyces sp. WMMB 714]|uniref:metal ABC transporter permease n=1 Tax=Streptomyces sp. WMMB 714 TaxID=1286822 RepID=UPI0008239587|nr:metal ABC transporter permease [Streptomyces sp. WMMB 714]SCK19141.1 zinc transport system permease protein [Streptomyces sp. WMMB 714]